MRNVTRAIRNSVSLSFPGVLQPVPDAKRKIAGCPDGRRIEDIPVLQQETIADNKNCKITELHFRVLVGNKYSTLYLAVEIQCAFSAKDMI